MEFRVLGPLEVTADGQSLRLAGVRTRAVFAMLLMHANQVVSSDRLLEELWPGQPADKAADSLQVRLSELRRALRSAGEADRLVTRPPGYLLRVAPGELDALRFEPHPTHFSLSQALAEVEALAPRQTYLTHLSHSFDHGPTQAGLPPGVALAHDGLQVEF